LVIIERWVITYELLTGAGFKVDGNLFGFKKKYKRVICVRGIETAVRKQLE